MANPKAVEAFTEMRTAMLLHTPWFASILLDIMETKVGKFPGIPTAGTDGVTIYYDEDFLLSLTLEERVFLTCHEVAHCFFMHMDRGKAFKTAGLCGQIFNPRLYNMAADYVINSLLTSPGSAIGKMPKGGLLSRKYTWEMSTEEVYRDLLSNPPPPKPNCNGGGEPGDEIGDSDEGSNGSGDQTGDGSGGDGESGMQEGFDSHIYRESPASDLEIKRAVAQATATAKSVGKMPANLDRWVDALLNPKVNWRELLRKLMEKTLGREVSTWATPHRRRLVTQKLYLPSYAGTSMKTVVWVTDTSGSIGQAEYDAAWAEFCDVLTVCRPKTTILMDCDTQVHNVHEIDDCDNVSPSQFPLSGGGGTSFRPPFDKVKDMGIEPAVLVYFTDGYGEFPPSPGYPVIWVMTTDIQPPFGECVRVELDA